MQIITRTKPSREQKVSHKMDKVLNLYRVDKVIKDSKIKESNE